MSAHKAYYQRIAAEARQRAATLAGGSRDATLNMAEVHETWAAHYDDVSSERQRLMDFAASSAQSDTHGSGVFCSCSPTGCGCSPLRGDTNAEAAAGRAEADRMFAERARASTSPIVEAALGERAARRYLQSQSREPGNFTREDMVARRRQRSAEWLKK